MRDIAKCTNKDCPVKETCLRWTSKAEEYQVYSGFEYKDGCEGYWDELDELINKPIKY